MVGDVEKFQQTIVDKVSNPISEEVNALKYIYVGRIVDAKGINELLNAWNIFQDGRNVGLYLIGGGPDKEKYEAKRHELGLDTVHFLGPVDYDKLPSYYQAADVFIIPTLEDNWSLVVPEAMASGLPIMCSEYNGCHPEYISKANGWVFDPLRIDDFMGKLEDSYNSEQLKEMGKHSKKIISKYTAQNAAENINRAIELAIS
jgi:glycosyltransferase involved in cell wall biosynthesis